MISGGGFWVGNSLYFGAGSPIGDDGRSASEEVFGGGLRVLVGGR